MAYFLASDIFLHQSVYKFYMKTDKFEKYAPSKVECVLSILFNFVGIKLNVFF